MTLNGVLVAVGVTCATCGKMVSYEHYFFERQRKKMKEGIHPTYEDATITCACGNVIKTRSTKKEMQVNTCSACHPYFTGQKSIVDTEGRVDTFKKRYAKFRKDA